MQGAEQLDDEGAAAVASLMASARGIGAPATSPLDYKQVTPAVMAGVWEVSSGSSDGRKPTN